MGFGFQIKQLDYDLTPVAGLALVGHQLQRLQGMFKRLDREHPAPGGVRCSDIVRSYVGLLAQGKSDFDAIEAFRGDRFFKQALGMAGVPSSPTLRQRLDAKAASWFDWAFDANSALLRSAQPDYGVLPCGWLPLDVDTFAMDNSGTVKDGVSRTYAGVDGYCPLAAYLGAHGFCLELALRPGAQHSASETTYNIERVVPLAQQLSAAGPKAPILMRLDAGFDSSALMTDIERCNAPGRPQVDFLIKWNPRTTDLQALLRQRAAEPAVLWHQPREGKRWTVWEIRVQVPGIERAVRRVLRLTERTIDARGQQLLVPDMQLDGWTTSLPETFSAATLIALYADHGTHEQFHAEFKTDMDLERLPSGKFDTNYLVCQFAALTMNILRLLGQQGLLGPLAPIRHAARRRRMKTVMQELIYRAGRVIEHAGRCWLGLGANDRAAPAFMHLHAQFASSG
ncbi:MAG: IS1380 family transposase [Thiomonas sp.]|uniref:IS1380 family transposase n=1 Tax=Acidithiobacillus sp. TaxID=1872118 RepID=UPI0025B902C7|nr:IS1380 family transposase [Acidithiobacillus sp.]